MRHARVKGRAKLAQPVQNWIGGGLPEAAMARGLKQVIQALDLGEIERRSISLPGACRGSR